MCELEATLTNVYSPVVTSVLLISDQDPETAAASHHWSLFSRAARHQHPWEQLAKCKLLF